MTEAKMPNANVANVLIVESDSKIGVDMYVEFDGKLIAKRGHHGTPQAGTWVSLEPGYAVRSLPNHEVITIEYNGVSSTFPRVVQVH
jgi:hypothetical protein